MYSTCTYDVNFSFNFFFIFLLRSTTSETTEDTPPQVQQAVEAPVIPSGGGGGGGDLIGDLLSLDISSQPTYTAPVANVGQLRALIRDEVEGL